jgi:hypothetical protein
MRDEVHKFMKIAMDKEPRRLDLDNFTAAFAVAGER